MPNLCEGGGIDARQYCQSRRCTKGRIGISIRYAALVETGAAGSHRINSIIRRRRPVDRDVVFQPLISERRSAGGGNGKCGLPAFINAAAGGTAANDWRECSTRDFDV